MTDDQDEVLADLDAPLDPVIGHFGEIQPDGSAELHLTDDGRRLFGNNIRIVVVNAAEPTADRPIEVLAK
jgi:hypothetical protein